MARAIRWGARYHHQTTRGIRAWILRLFNQCFQTLQMLLQRREQNLLSKRGTLQLQTVTARLLWIAHQWWHRLFRNRKMYTRRTSYNLHRHRGAKEPPRTVPNRRQASSQWVNSVSLQALEVFAHLDPFSYPGVPTSKTQVSTLRRTRMNYQCFRLTMWVTLAGPR